MTLALFVLALLWGGSWVSGKIVLMDSLLGAILFWLWVALLLVGNVAAWVLL